MRSSRLAPEKLPAVATATNTDIDESVHPAFQEMRECLQRIVDSFSR